MVEQREGCGHFESTYSTRKNWSVKEVNTKYLKAKEVNTNTKGTGWKKGWGQCEVESCIKGE